MPALAPLAAALTAIDGRYADLLRAFLPENPQFERERIVASFERKRELVFACGLLNEGEHEALLLLELIAARAAAEPHAPLDHLIDEMAYYLRTSIDATWQLVARPTQPLAAVAYFLAVLDARTALLRERRPVPLPAFVRNRATLIAAEAETAT